MGAAATKILLPLGVWLLKRFFEKVANDIESKKQFLLFVDAMERDQLAGVRLNTDDRAQAAELRAAREKDSRADT